MPIKPFVLCFPHADLPRYAREFSYRRSSAAAIVAGQAAARDGYYTRERALEIVNWKSPRTKGRLTSTDAAIRAATATALAADVETARMEALTALPGVGVPVASALLLYAAGDTYPIFDRNALASLGHRPRGVYPTSFWIRYLDFVRQLANDNDMTPREVEKALWEFEKQRQAPC